MLTHVSRITQCLLNAQLKIRLETQQLCELTAELSDELFVQAYVEILGRGRPYDYVKDFRHPVHFISYRRIGSVIA